MKNSQKKTLRTWLESKNFTAKSTLKKCRDSRRRRSGREDE